LIRDRELRVRIKTSSNTMRLEYLTSRHYPNLYCSKINVPLLGTKWQWNHNRQELDISCSVRHRTLPRIEDSLP
jgi:hypothetical protein